MPGEVVWCFLMMDVAAIGSTRRDAVLSRRLLRDAYMVAVVQRSARRIVAPQTGVRVSSVTPTTSRGDHSVRLLQPPTCPLKRLKPVRLLRALRGLGC